MSKLTPSIVARPKHLIGADGTDIPRLSRRPSGWGWFSKLFSYVGRQADGDNNEEHEPAQRHEHPQPL
jgi:hypothetical protein